MSTSDPRERQWQRLIKRIGDIKSRGIQPIYWNKQHVGYDYLSLLLDLKDDESGFSVAPLRLRETNKFICYAGVCVAPRLSLSAQDAKQVMDAWIWFMNQLSIDAEEFTQTVEKTSVLSFLHDYTATPIPYKVIGLAVDLYRLHEDNINVVPKVTRLNKHIRGYVNKAKKELTVLSKFYKISELLAFLEDISSETKLATIARHVGYEHIELGESPDLKVETILIEVKHPKEGTESAIRNAIERGFERANFVAIDNLEYKKKWLRGYKITDLAETRLVKAFKTAMSLTKNNQRCLLFFGNRMFPNMTVDYVGRVVKIRD